MTADKDGFTIVTHSRKKKSCKTESIEFAKRIQQTLEDSSNFGEDDLLIAKRDMSLSLSKFRESKFYQSFIKSFLGNKVVSDIHSLVCFGLGTFLTKNPISNSSKVQLLFLLSLKSDLGIETSLVSDPIFFKSEIRFLQDSGLTVLKENIEGKFKVKEKTLFFLPHCPKQLTNNLLWSNWKDLDNIIIISNSFSCICDFSTDKELNSVYYLKKASNFVKETLIENNYQDLTIFNDLSFHTFDCSSLDLEEPDKLPPQYDINDIEFVKAL
uniref:AGAP005113PAlike [Tribolium castaneum] n=2 Tax=Lepeophtheirus salmonis TaxID=72036 RepID=A0A0K2TYN8_LEPSM